MARQRRIIEAWYNLASTIILAQYCQKENGPVAEAFELGLYTFGDLTPDAKLAR
jgi:hypothetical protein